MKFKAVWILPAALILLIAASTAMGDKKSTWQEVAGELMSPACPGRLVLDCPSGEGEQLRTMIKQKLAAGWTKKQITDYFIGIYGEEYRAAPVKKGFYLLAWIVPFILIGVGAFVVFLVVRVWKKSGELAEAEEVSPIDMSEGEKSALSRKLDEELNKFDY